MSAVITGFNLFQQWSEHNLIMKSFTAPSLQYNSKKYDMSSDSNIELLYYSWSYNIYRMYNEIYYSGLDAKNVISPVVLPFDLKTDVNKLSVSGNDTYLLLLDSIENTVWKAKLGSTQPWQWHRVQQFHNTAINDNLVTLKTSCSLHLCLSDKGIMYNIPFKVNTDHCVGRIIDIQCGHEHALLLTSEGQVYTWGNGRRCQLGHGDLQNYDEPHLVEALAGVRIVIIRAGGWHCCALSESGDLYVWGWNNSGQLGVRTNNYNASTKITETATELSSLPLPTLVEIHNSTGNILDHNITDVSCGTQHTVIVLDDGSLWGSGSNKYGQLGMGDIEIVSCFQKINFIKTKFRLTCGPWSTILLNQ